MFPGCVRRLLPLEPVLQDTGFFGFTLDGVAIFETRPRTAQR
jgi:hypothetical protein